MNQKQTHNIDRYKQLIGSLLPSLDYLPKIFEIVKNNPSLVNGLISSADELVAFIKEKYGDYFCVVVAGYPEVHS